jgi:predicted ArsR family transcriptional regulator
MAEQKQMLVIDSDTQKKIIDLLGSKGPMTRGDMVQQLQLARTTIYDSLVKLRNRNVVDKYPVNNSKVGRPKVVFTLKNGLVAG